MSPDWIGSIQIRQGKMGTKTRGVENEKKLPNFETYAPCRSGPVRNARKAVNRGKMSGEVGVTHHWAGRAHNHQEDEIDGKGVIIKRPLHILDRKKRFWSIGWQTKEVRMRWEGKLARQWRGKKTRTQTKVSSKISSKQGRAA